MEKQLSVEYEVVSSEVRLTWGLHLPSCVTWGKFSPYSGPTSPPKSNGIIMLALMDMCAFCHHKCPYLRKTTLIFLGGNHFFPC